MAKISILALLVLAALAVAAWARSSRRALPVPRPRLRHPAIRIACGVAALALIAGLILGTIRGDRGYAPADLSAIPVAVETGARDALELAEDGSVLHGRLLVDLFLIETGASGSPILSLAHTQRALSWPEDAGQAIRVAAAGDGWQAAYEIDFAKALVDPHTGELGLSGHVESSRWTGTSLENFSNPVDIRYRGDLQSASGALPTPFAWSLFPLPARRISSLAVVAPLGRAGDGSDALRDEPAVAFLKERTIPRPPDRLSETTASDDPPALRLAAHLGWSALVLALAALSTAQCFRRRALAFAGSLAAALALTAVIDGAMLRTHLRVAETTTAPLSERLAAVAWTGGTFFHRRAAAERLGALAERGGTPEELRTTIRSALAVR